MGLFDEAWTPEKTGTPEWWGIVFLGTVILLGAVGVFLGCCLFLWVLAL